jgi:hypothetical protein
MRRRCCCTDPPETVLCNVNIQPHVCRIPPLLSAQYIIDLPSISNTAADRFNTSGGEFVVDYSTNGLTPDGHVLNYASGGDSVCNFFGANIGTECGVIVRAFVSFRSDTAATLSFGYMKDVNVSPFTSNVIYGRKPYQSYPFDPASTCSNMDRTWSFTGFTTNGASNCVPIIGFTQTIPNYDHRLRSA